MSLLLNFRRFLHSSHFPIPIIPFYPTSHLNTMETQVKTIDPSTIKFLSEEIEDPQFSTLDPKTFSILKDAVRLLTGDNVIAIPTETVYGLASNALSSSAIKKIYLVKNRPADNPLIVHISSLKMLRSLLPPKENDSVGEIPE